MRYSFAEVYSCAEAFRSFGVSLQEAARIMSGVFSQFAVVPRSGCASEVQWAIRLARYAALYPGKALLDEEGLNV